MSFDVINPNVRGPGPMPPLLAECNDPAEQRHNLAGPWREGQEVFATDGCMVVRCPAAALAPAVFEAVPPWDESRPRDLAGQIMKFPPFAAEAQPLKPVPHEPPMCSACKGTGRAGLVIGNTTPCATCGGKGRLPRSGDGIHLGAGFWLDRWYVSLLNQHGARVFPPLQSRGVEWQGNQFVIGVVQFSVPLPAGRELIGYVMTWVPQPLVEALESTPVAPAPSPRKLAMVGALLSPKLRGRRR